MPGPRRFQGRPRSQLVNLVDLSTRGRARLSRKLDPQRELAEQILLTMPPKDRLILERYLTYSQDDYALAGTILALQWVLGEGLNQISFRRSFSEEWSEDYETLSEPWRK